MANTSCLICSSLIISGDAYAVFKGTSNSDESFTANRIWGMIHIKCLDECEGINKLKLPITFIVGD